MYGLITLLVATVEAGVMAIVKSYRRSRQNRAAAKAAPVTAAQLAAPETDPLSAARPRELNGRATAGPSGQLTAPLSGTPCVWYAITVKERFQAWRPGPLGPIQVERHTPLVTQVSGDLRLRDETGIVTVDPRGAELALGQPAVSGFETVGDAAAPESLTARVGRLIAAPIQGRHRTMTVGFLVEEIAISEDEELHVIGHVRTDLAEPVVGQKGHRPFVISRGSAMPTAGSPGDHLPA